MSSENPAVQKAPSRFRYMMLKEIYEQPEAVRLTLARHVSDGGRITLDRDPLSEDEVRNLSRVTIAASGASRHAGMCGKIMIEELVRIPVEVEHASEYCYRRPVQPEGTLLVVITQSGETADTIAAMRIGHEAGLKTLAVSNVAESTIAGESDGALLTFAGKEVAIPATKSFTAQLTALYILALYLASVRRTLSGMEISRFVSELAVLPNKMSTALESFDQHAEIIARSYFRDQSFLFLGRGVHHPIALEGALKLKEISYIHAEGYPTGELRHGPTALVDESTPLVGIVTRDPTDAGSMLRYEKTLAVLEEVRAHSDRQILIASEGDDEIAALGLPMFTVPSASELLSPILEIVPLQLLAYHIAILNNFDVDRPRNLVKSVQQD
jgi:glucosamine--fructose-6-phosphate aminotransferase (isomerizing)